MIALELFTNILAKKEEEMGYGFFNPYTDFTRVINPRIAPTHYTTEGGGTYSLRPDLARMGGPNTYVAVGLGTVLLGVAVTSGAIVNAYGIVIQREAQNVQRSMWRGFAQGLTGGPGVGTALDL